MHLYYMSYDYIYAFILINSKGKSIVTSIKIHSNEKENSIPKKSQSLFYIHIHNDIYN